ncbi:ring-variant domain containing protein [Dermatophagoides farinae]|uniref:Ring-variant domain containing protein n=1 Tax=Dermatophagoides farinae TaxID=6954 RepID=A0A9D4SFY7_DERFA|nr:ring-variant domain containing protein [Dermatophagoides farinae]
MAAQTIMINNDKNQIDQNDLERIFRKRLCRICRGSNVDVDKFITACKCLGPFAYVHQKCFECWLEITRQQKCDICRYDFQVTLHNRSFFEWIHYQTTTANDSEYLRSFIQLFTRLHNVIFISLIGIVIIVCYNNNDDDECLNPQQSPQQSATNILNDVDTRQTIWYSLLVVFIPNIRISVISLSMIWFAARIWNEFRQWQQRNQRVQISPFINSTMNVGSQNPRDYGILNSFVRVSGLKHVGKYLRLTSNISSNNLSDNNNDNKKDN